MSYRNLTLLILVLFFSLGLAYPARAAQWGDAYLPGNEVKQGPLVLTGSRVTVEGQVNGDLYIIGGEVKVEGTVRGDLFCAAQKVTVDGQVAGDIRLLATESYLNAPCPGSVTVLGDSLWLWQSARAEKGLYLGVSSAQLNGRVDGRLAGNAGSVYINGPVNGDTDLVVSDHLALGSEARLAGALKYRSPQAARVETGAQIKGPRDWKPIPRARGLNLLDVFFSWAGAFVIWWLFSLINPGIWGSWAGSLIHRPWISLGLGLLALFTLPFLVFMLIITVVGIPAAVIIALLVAIVGYLGRVVIAVGFSYFLAGTWRINQGMAVLMALGPIVLAVYLPRLGMLFLLTYACLGTGSLIYMLWWRRRTSGVDNVA